MALEDLKQALNNVSSRAIENWKIATVHYTSRVNDVTRIMDAENKFASVCSYAYMKAFRPIAQKLACSTTDPFTECYIDLLSTATRKILAGQDPLELIEEYEAVLEEWMHGKKAKQ